jgi:hypothetical protein
MWEIIDYAIKPHEKKVRMITHDAGIYFMKYLASPGF